jgi:hypothetical protein
LLSVTWTSATVLDLRHPLGVGDAGADGVGQVEEERLVQLVQRVAVDLDGDGLDQVAGLEGQRTTDGVVVVAGDGGPVGRGVVHGDGDVEDVGQAHDEGGQEGVGVALGEGDVIHRQPRRVGDDEQ